MKINKLIMLVLVLIPLGVFSNLSARNKNYSNNTAITAQCQLQEAPSIFVLNALFANPENPYPVELWENRDNEVINIFDLAREIKSIAKFKEKVLSHSDELEHASLLERLAQMEDIADRALLMEADKWKPGYVNELMKHIVGIRHAGISELLPNVVDPSNCKDEPLSSNKLNKGNESEDRLRSDRKKDKIVNPCDDNGRPWASLMRLSDPNTEGPSIAKYMQDCGTDVQLVKTWWDNQLESSWEYVCWAVKIFFSNQRTLDPKSYYWTKAGYEFAKDEYSNLWKNGRLDDGNLCYEGTGDQEDLYIKAFTIWHAYVQEVLSKVKFFHNDQSNKEVCLIRTNSQRALNSNNITRFGKGYRIPSASYDSFSLINIFEKGNRNNVITESLVPHHRIIHLYSLMNPNEEDLRESTDFIMKNYYDASGSRIIDPKGLSAVEKLVKFKYDELTEMAKSDSLTKLSDSLKRLFFDGNFSELKSNERFSVLLNNLNKTALEIIEVLPEKLQIDNAKEVLLSILMRRTEKNWGGNELFSETEFIVLSGPDLPFDYFYNAGGNLSQFEKRLDNGESVCGFWPVIDDLKQIGHLGGSTGALLYEDSKTDRKYVLKKGASPGHIREEALADLLYEAAGIAIPESRLYETLEGPVKVAAYPENAEPLYKAYYKSNEIGRQQLRNKISEGFVIDALVANFDVIGLEMDNIFVGEDGQVFRVNNGASFRYLAQGKLKNDNPDESRKSWNPSPITLWTLRDPKINENSALIFADVNIYEIAEKIKKLEASYSTDLEKNETQSYFIHQNMISHVTEIFLAIRARFNNFLKVANKALEMKANGISPEEADIELRKWVEAEDWGPAFWVFLLPNT